MMKKMMIRRVLVVITFLTYLSTYSINFGQTPEATAKEKMNDLQALITIADAAELDATKEKMTLHTAKLFLDYAQWDEDNISTNKQYYEDHPYYKDDAQKMAEDLPDFERESVVEILDQAIEELTKILEGKIVRRPIPVADWSKVSIDGAKLMENGRPVFLADYTWKQDDNNLQKYYGDLGGAYITPNNITDDKGNYKTWPYNEIKNMPEGHIGSIFLDNNVIPAWAKTKYPGLQTGGRHYGKYDLDNDGSREMYSLLFEKFVPLMAGKKYTQLGYMLFNEPSYFTKKGSWNSTDDDGVCVSSYTIDKFKTWLATQHSTIEDLNALWGTSFADFYSVTIELPMDGSKQGSPIWYDWMTFNNHRVTEWFKFVKSDIRKYDNEAKVHIKLMPWLWSENSKDHGMDFESLSEMCDIIGCDAGAAYYYAWGNEPWKDKYALNWRESIMTFDFFKSVQPNQVIFDTENHFLMKTAFIEYDLNQDYVNAIYWMGFMHGLSATRTWVWARNTDGSIISNRGTDGGYIVSAAHQPKTLNTLTATLMDLNSHSEEIVKIQEQQKPIRVFYSKTSAINNPVYMDKVYETYESLFFEGVPVGFATENILKKTPEWELVVVNNTEFVTQSELDAIQAYLDNGGTVVLGENSLKKNEYGQTLEGLIQGEGTLIQVNSIADLKTKTFEEISKADLMPEVSVVEINSIGVDGCAWRCIKNEAGNYVLSIVNLGKGDAKLDIALKNAKVGTKTTNLLTGMEVYAKPTLKPYQVFFVEVTDEEGTDHEITSVEKRSKYEANDDFVKLFPNPGKGEFVIDTQSINRDLLVSVYDSQGREVLKHEIHNAERYLLDINGYSNGLYFVHVKSGKDNQVVKLIKQ